MSFRQTILGFLTCLLATDANAGILPDTLPTGGINMADYNYYDHGVPFVDYAKMGHEWLSSDGQRLVGQSPIGLNAVRAIRRPWLRTKLPAR